MFDRDWRIVFGKFGFTSSGFCFSLVDYHGALNVTITSTVEKWVERKQMVYANLEFEAQRKMLNSFLLVGGKREKR